MAACGLALVSNYRIDRFFNHDLLRLFIPGRSKSLLNIKNSNPAEMIIWNEEIDYKILFGEFMPMDWRIRRLAAKKLLI